MAGRISPIEVGRRRDSSETDQARLYDRALLDLSMGDAVTRGELATALQEICRQASHTLGVRRSGVWLFDAKLGRMRSAVLYDRETGTFLPDLEVSVAQDAVGAELLGRERIVAIDDVYRDPRTEGFSEAYLAPHGIAALLSAPVRQGSRLVGAVCHEHVGRPRAWKAEEQRFAASLGDLVALALAADERARAQFALRDSEARHRLLVDGARDLIFNLDGAGSITSLNPALQTILARRPEDWVGRHFEGLLHPEDAPVAFEMFRRAVAGEYVPIFEIRLTRADGEPVWFEFTVSVHREGDRVLCVFGVGRDVTARKWAEFRRHATSSIARALAASGDDPVRRLAAVHEHLARALPCERVATLLVDDATGELVLAGRRFDELLALEGEVADFPPRDLVGRAVRANETVVVETRHRRGAGAGERSCATIVSTLRSPDQVIGALVAEREGGTFDPEQVEMCEVVAREIGLAIEASRRRAEERENADVASALARVGEVLIASVDLPVLLEHLCRMTAEVLGCDASHTFLRDEERGVFDQAASYGDPPILAEALRALPISDRDAQGVVAMLEREWVVVTRPNDGTFADRVWQAYETRSALVIALRRGDRVIGAQSAVFRQSTGEFGARHLRIATGIARLASLALANARLVSELESASRIKSDFVATISHELRTPLNVILGYNELLLSEEFGRLDPAQMDALESVGMSARELLTLIEATLDLSRLETGRMPLDVVEVDLARWLEEVRLESAPLCERKPELSFEWLAPPAGSTAYTDALKLKVILKNLISNAIKFTHRGGVAIAVAVHGGVLEVVVRDSGVGMTPETRAVIFEAFRQGDGSMTRQYGGVGLGLYIVARILDALDGSVIVESAPGIGSTFRIQIPAQRRVATSDAVSQV